MTQHLHFAIFCIVPVIGVAFVRMMELTGEGEEMEGHSSDAHSGDKHESAETMKDDDIAYISVALFLIFSGIMDSSVHRAAASVFYILVAFFFETSVGFAIVFIPVSMLAIVIDEIRYNEVEFGE